MESGKKQSQKKEQQGKKTSASREDTQEEEKRTLHILGKHHRFQEEIINGKEQEYTTQGKEDKKPSCIDGKVLHIVPSLMDSSSFCLEILWKTT